VLAQLGCISLYIGIRKEQRKLYIVPHFVIRESSTDAPSVIYLFIRVVHHLLFVKFILVGVGQSSSLLLLYKQLGSRVLVVLFFF